MFGTIAKMLIPGTSLILVLYLFQGNGILKTLLVTFSFLMGACCSSAAGVAGMWTSTRANVRVARTSCVGNSRQTIVVALRSGAIVGITVVSMAVLGISLLFAIAKSLTGR